MGRPIRRIRLLSVFCRPVRAPGRHRMDTLGVGRVPPTRRESIPTDKLQITEIDWEGPRSQRRKNLHAPRAKQEPEELVRDRGFEPLTPSVSRKCSTPELTAHQLQNTIGIPPSRQEQTLRAFWPKTFENPNNTCLFWQVLHCCASPDWASFSLGKHRVCVHVRGTLATGSRQIHAKKWQTLANR